MGELAEQHRDQLGPAAKALGAPFRFILFDQRSELGPGKMLEQYAAYRPFTELDRAIGISPDDWWMLDEHGQKKPMMNMWLDHLGDAAFNLAAEPTADSYSRMNFPVLTVTGFYDDDQPGALHYYRNYVAGADEAGILRWNGGESMNCSQNRIPTTKKLACASQMCTA